MYKKEYIEGIARREKIEAETLTVAEQRELRNRIRQQDIERRQATVIQAFVRGSLSRKRFKFVSKVPKKKRKKKTKEAKEILKKNKRDPF